LCIFYLGEEVRRRILTVLLSLLLAALPTLASDIRPVDAEAQLVLEMAVSNTTISIGQEINITLILTNTGNTTFTKTYYNTPAPGFNTYYLASSPWGFYYDPFGGIGIPVVVEVTIPPGENITRRYEWDLYREDYLTGLHYPPPPGTYNLYGWCDLTHTLSIFDLLGNDVFVPVTVVGDWWNAADLNYDFIVDIYDLVITANAYGSTPSDPNWNPHCDIAEPYGVIDIFDIVLIASSYGEAYTP
jgi:hypothetical protein